MRFKNKLLTTSLLVGTSMLATPAFAQAQQPVAGEDANQPAVTTQADPQVQEDQANVSTESEIVVTGTLIRNPNLVSSSPVNVVNESEITLRAPNNAEELIRRIPGVSPGIGSQVNNGSNGTNSVDLRGLGTQRNLVLLDGNRIVPTLANGVVDLNVIPVALISRVDVLTGGASTTYGADAVSGVVNFITNRSFSGIDARAAYKVTEQGDGQSHRVDLTMGGNFADDRGNAVLSFGYTKVEPVYQTRPFALFGISPTTGRASGSSATTTPTNINFGGATSYQQLNPGATAFVPYYEGFNFNPYNIFQTPLERKSAYGAVTYDVADGIEAYARGIFSQNEISSIIAPSGIFGNPLVVNADNPYLTPALRDQICTFNGIALGATCTGRTGSTATTGLPLPAVYRRLVELGPRIGNYKNTVYDARAGVLLDVTASTNLDLSVSYGKSEQINTNSGYVLNSRVQQALIATNTTTCTTNTFNCVPLNLFGVTGSITPAQVAFLQGEATIAITTQLQQARALYSGDIGFSAPWASNPVSFALGGEYRRYTYDRNPDARSQDPSELGGAGGATLPFTGGFNVKEAFAELIAPIASDRPFFDELTLEAGIRYSDYSIDAVGDPSFDTTTYKFGGTWQPVEGFRLRGNYQRAVRAPNIGELFAPVVTGLTSLSVDPCAGAAPTTNATLRDVCLAQGAPLGSIGNIPNPVAGQPNATGGGNPLLSPEKAKTFTVGAVVTPRNFLPGFSASLDYYNIKITDAITSPTPGDAIGACFNALSATNPACLSIRRNPVSGGLSGPTGTVRGLLLTTQNTGRLETSGFDLTVNYDRDLGPARLGLNFAGNYTKDLKFQSQPAGVNRDCVGFFSPNCGPSLGQLQPKYSFTQRTSLGFGAATLSLLWRHIGKMTYEGLADDYVARGFTAANRYLFVGTVTNQGPARSALAGNSYDFNRIDAYNYFDLNAQFDIERRFQFTIGVQNLFDKQPPIIGSPGTGTTSANSGNTFPSTYDPLGRSYSASVRVKF
ncbi:TonB-dependent receptor domain-containing protein [Sphingomonas glaciei]|uniref:TonB-dependent receptor n=1 Tax=Sphingomonas glaciei TaxID=2938948 RepID=A0ABY5MSH5_9SPHN|nr:TonB-dependent receptor [Sphingomonas glaciei]UUR07453.1 TonB-dependent receptor [Sphingomonas glaciei]